MNAALPIPPGLLAAGLALLALALGLGWALSAEARVAYRVIWQFFATIALPVLVLLGVPLVLLYSLVELDPRLWQALIAGLVIATGWLTTAIFAELARRRQRAERLRDYHKALYAEIGNTLASLYDEGRGEDHVAATVARMRAEADFVPFIPRERHDHVYDAVITEIDVLPRQTIDAIVAYYSLVKSIGALADDMRGEGFRQLAPERRIAIYSDYAEMRRQAFAFGQYALALIKAFSEGGARAAVQVQEAARAGRLQGSPGVSSPGGDRSGPSRGSG